MGGVDGKGRRGDVGRLRKWMGIRNEENGKRNRGMRCEWVRVLRGSTGEGKADGEGKGDGEGRGDKRRERGREEKGMERGAGKNGKGK